MAHLVRLIVGFFFLWSGAVSAAIPTVTGYKWPGDNVTAYPTIEAACKAWLAAVPNGANYNYAPHDGTMCKVTPKTGGAVTSWGQVQPVSGVCPSNSTPSGGACVCTAPYVEDSTHTACVLPPSPLEDFCRQHADAKNPFPARGDIPASGAVPTSSCYVPYPPFPGPDAGKGCTMTNGDYVAAPNDSGGRSWSATGLMTGGTCTPSGAPDGEPKKSESNPCPNGFPGSVNGTDVCVKREPDKGIEGVKGTETKNADGTSTTTKETTKCNAGVCTTTKETTQRDSSGNIIGVPKVEETKEPVGDKCNKDPGSKLCASVGMGDGEGGGGLTGNCVAGFVAKGEDPILNAMALEQHKRNCELMRTDTEPSAWAAAEGAKTDNVMADNPLNSTVSIGASNFDTSDALGGGGCSLNKTLTVRGISVALPFNVLCDPLAVLGQILVAVSLLLAARIVTRG